MQDANLKDKATEAMHAAEARLQATLKTIEARTEELRRWGGKNAAAAQEQAREIVDDRPLAVVGVAFGIGVLIGILASR